MIGIRNVLSIGLILVGSLLLFPRMAEAGFWDQVKAIYNAPDTIDDLQQQYQATRDALESQLSEQREQLENSRKQAEELLSQQEQMVQRQLELQGENESIRQANETVLAVNEAYRLEKDAYRQENDAYREANEALLAENMAMLERIERAEQERKALYRKLTYAAGALIALLAAYALAVRLWRYLVWRRQGRAMYREAG